MKEIILTKGKIAIVDDEDYEELCKFNWVAKESGNETFYAVRRNPIIGNHLYMHKQLMKFPTLEVDHINGNSLDNRKENLRACSHKENLRNRKIPSNNTSGYVGVSFNSRNKYRPWVVYIKTGKNHIYLGSFSSKIDAAKAYNEKASELFGEFARLNILEAG